MSSKKHYLNQAGNSIQGHFQNHGVQLNGNNISVGGNFTISKQPVPTKAWEEDQS